MGEEQMAAFTSFKNKAIAKVITRFPSLAKHFINSYKACETKDGVPWTPACKTLSNCTVALVTTSGVHHKDQKPFNMTDKAGDPTYRIIDLKKPLSDLMITHDYYDHADADKDINIVFPVERLREFEKLGIIGRLADTAYAFMGHIDGPHIDTLVAKSAPEIAKKLKADGVDIVLLTPA
jgi:D-proline reductase (dithiol) PrdB